jgi:hypothetical protein
MKSNRVEAQVLRSEPGAVRFELPAAAHPGLIGQPAESCADCHKAALPAKTTRASRSARFDHAQHVAKDAAPQSCAVCHLDVATADGSTHIGVPFSGAVPAALDPASLLTFDQDACTTCHPGIAIDAASLAPAEPRTVREFSHAHHMARATDPARPGAAVQCATCHDVATSTRGQLVGTLPRAQDCTMCHVHDAEHAPWTGRIHGADVASCAVCHEDRMPPLSFRRANVASAQVTLSGAGASSTPPSPSPWPRCRPSSGWPGRGPSR